MSKTGFLRSLTAATLAATVFASSSMFALAAPGKVQMGELTVTGGTEVTINGETANTGRTVFSSNTIATPSNTSAIINLGKLGQVELAPNSSINLTFDETGISGALANGRVKVFGAPEAAANITTKTGSVIAEPNQTKSFTVSFDGAKTEATSEAGAVTLNEGGKVVQVGTTQQDDDGGFSAGSAAVYAVIFGAAAAALIYIAVRDNNEVNAGSGVIVSPTR